ncbi:thiamine ABC transporter substrate binding subunit [Agarivorans sp. B2Z047]|uniref:thiamine ABC transporter substrate binding subunit n=1 Tax=Agarivorans sp. B2Z047 TaxID=2652721 RepID=UPI00128BEC78|nr:thiamine ABC transporter substrate binding subunit [Agarivorans sp. B2Z047]MPW29204.1 thiamine ABC transporter substrate binding subunit [Agarivorans sp. B2Z047]UQN41757.1 thiamine ABC transporter substrate binding subunit [Agarivorans sp. B2Z047]
MKKLLWLACCTLSVFGLNAQANSELTVYTYQSFVSDWGPGPALSKAFEAECNCSINWVGLDDGVAILNRLKLEGKRNKADIILGLDTNLIPEAEAIGAVQAHQLTLPNLAIDWQDNNFVPYDYGYFAFIYNTESLKNKPSSMKELINEFDGTILYQDPRTSTVGQGLMLWLKALYGDDTEQAWSKLKDKTVTVTKGWSEAYGMFLKGEADLVLSYTTSPAYHMVAEQENRYQALGFSEGHMSQVEVAAISATSQQVELAQQFLAFLVSAPAQQVIATTNWMLPVNPEAELPEAFSTLVTPKALSLDQATVSQQRKAWTKEWRNTVSQ